jgi:hypothetical protein
MGAGDKGGDYIEKLDDVMDTVKRYAYAMYIAGHPNLYRQEYAKKLYKNLSESMPSENTDTVMRLSMLMANSTKLSPEQLQEQLERLRATLKPIQQKRQQNRKLAELTKEFPLDTTPWNWEVNMRGHSRKVELIATGKRAAIENAQREQGWPWVGQPLSKFEATPISPARGDNSLKTFKVVHPRTGETMFTVKANTGHDAAHEALEMLEGDGKIETEFELKNDRDQVVFYNSEQNRRNIGYRRNQSRPRDDQTGPRHDPSGPIPIPGPGGQFTGEWKVVSDTTGDTVYTFSGIGNNQADANRVGANWVRNNSVLLHRQGSEFSVLPVMG